jgi:hypothetical protein
MLAVADITRDFYETEGAYKALAAKLVKVEDRVSVFQTELVSATGAQELLQAMADQERDVLQRRIESLVTYGLQAVFGDEYAFRLVQGISRNLVVWDFELLKDGRPTVLAEAHGGGVLAVVGVLLRTVVISAVRHPQAAATR